MTSVGGASSTGASGVVLGRAKKDVTVTQLVAWGASACRVGAAGVASAAAASCRQRWAARAEGLCLSSESVFFSVHIVRYRKLLLFGLQMMVFRVLSGRRSGPGGWYLTYPGDKNWPLLSGVIFVLYQRGWFLWSGGI